MELKVWVEGIQRIVCGVTEATSCQDVVYALAHATGRTGRFTLIERWRNNERLLAPHEQPLKILLKWGEYSADVNFILQRTALEQKGDQKLSVENGLGQNQTGHCQVNKPTPVSMQCSQKSVLSPSGSSPTAHIPMQHKDIKKSLTFSGAHNAPHFSAYINKDISSAANVKVGVKQPGFAPILPPNAHLSCHSASPQDSSLPDKNFNHPLKGSLPISFRPSPVVNRPPVPPPYEVVRGNPPPPPASISHPNPFLKQGNSPSKSARNTPLNFPPISNAVFSGSSKGSSHHQAKNNQAFYETQPPFLPNNLRINHNNFNPLDRPRDLPPPYRDPPPPPPPSHPALIKITSQATKSSVPVISYQMSASAKWGATGDNFVPMHSSHLTNHSHASEFKSQLEETTRADLHTHYNLQHDKLAFYPHNENVAYQSAFNHVAPHQVSPLENVCSLSKNSDHDAKSIENAHHSTMSHTFREHTQEESISQTETRNLPANNVNKSIFSKSQENKSGGAEQSAAESNQNLTDKTNLDPLNSKSSELCDNNNYVSKSKNSLPVPGNGSKLKLIDNDVNVASVNSIKNTSPKYDANLDDIEKSAVFSFSRDLDKSLVKELLHELSKESTKDGPVSLGILDQCMEEVVIDGYYRDLVQLVNLQREKLNFQQVELTKYEAEISYLEGRHKEEQSRLTYLQTEITKLEKEEENLKSNMNNDESNGNATLPDEANQRHLVDYKNRILQLTTEARKLEERLDKERQQQLISSASKEEEEQAIIREIEKLQCAIQQTHTQSESASCVSKDIEIELNNIDMIVKGKYDEIDGLRTDLRDENLVALTLTSPDEQKSSEGNSKFGKGRKMVGSPRQLETAVPTSKNPHGVWV